MLDIALTRYMHFTFEYQFKDNTILTKSCNIPSNTVFGTSVKRLPLTEKKQRIHQNIDGFKIEQGDLDIDGDFNPSGVNAPLSPVHDGDAANISVLENKYVHQASNIISLQEKMYTCQSGGAAGYNSRC